MFTLKRRKDAFRFLLPKEFIPEEINAKYSRILKEAKSFYTSPIDFLNESIQKIEVFGFTGATIIQQQTNHAYPLHNIRNLNNAQFQSGYSEVSYRSPDSILKLFDKTLNIEFRHSLANLNYFILLESFMYQYAKDAYFVPEYNFKIELLNENGAVYSNIVLDKPLIDSLDMLSFDNTSTISQTESFKCVFKYSNFDYQFIITDYISSQIDLDEYIDSLEQDYPYDISQYPMTNNSTRMPKYKSNFPDSGIGGGLNYKEDNSLSRGQIFYDDEGGVLEDIIHHNKVNTPGILDKNPEGSLNNGNSNNNSVNSSNGNNGSSNNGSSNESNNQNGNQNNANDMNSKDNDPGSFIDIIASGKYEYNDGLAENEKFWFYPYDKDYFNRSRKTLNTFPVIDNSITRVNENGEKTNEYKNNEDWKNWEELDSKKFKK